MTKFIFDLNQHPRSFSSAEQFNAKNQLEKTERCNHSQYRNSCLSHFAHSLCYKVVSIRCTFKDDQGYVGTFREYRGYRGKNISSVTDNRLNLPFYNMLGYTSTVHFKILLTGLNKDLLPTLFNIVTPDSDSTILFNIIEQCGQHMFLSTLNKC